MFHVIGSIRHFWFLVLAFYRLPLQRFITLPSMQEAYYFRHYYHDNEISGIITALALLSTRVISLSISIYGYFDIDSLSLHIHIGNYRLALLLFQLFHVISALIFERYWYMFLICCRILLQYSISRFQVILVVFFISRWLHYYYLLQYMHCCHHFSAKSQCFLFKISAIFRLFFAFHSFDFKDII